MAMRIQMDDLAPMEGTTLAPQAPIEEQAIILKTPSGEKIVYKSQALQKQRDDFGAAPQTQEEAEAALARELAIKPKASSPCIVCGTVHVKEGDPICICAKCGQVGRIVWCGYCTACAFNRLTELAGVNPDDVAKMPMFQKYVAWKQEQARKLAEGDKMPWE